MWLYLESKLELYSEFGIEKFPFLPILIVKLLSNFYSHLSPKQLRVINRISKKIAIEIIDGKWNIEDALDRDSSIDIKSYFFNSYVCLINEMDRQGEKVYEDRSLYKIFKFYIEECILKETMRTLLGGLQRLGSEDLIKLYKDNMLKKFGKIPDSIYELDLEIDTIKILKE